MTDPTPPRLRVMRVIARLNVGGPALEVTSLHEDHDPVRFDHRLLTGDVDPGEGDYLQLRGSTPGVERVPGLGRSPDAFGDLRALRALAAEVRAFRPHIVHTHTAKAGVLGRVVARALRVPAVVHTYHGHLLHGYFSPGVTKAVVLTERGLARTTTRLVAGGTQVRDDLLEAGVGRPEQYVVTPPGVFLRPAPSPAEARSALDLPPGGPVVTLLARLTGIKRPERFVAAARSLAVEHPDATFVVCGDGELLEALRHQAADLGDRIRFLGWRGDVETVYAATDLVVLTSDNEGMPVSLMEAALAGVPAVSTSVGSVGEVVEDGVTGLLCSTDVTAISSAVGRLLSSPALRERMGTAAAVRAAALFGRSRLVADTERLYEQIAVEKGLC
ncbi:MAG: hypothetical protein JWN57_1000 [Frankiales bacterium]|nr:hypothetical protein [Frankiales bacterium]